MSIEVLNEYVDISIKIQNMWNAIDEYRKTVENKLSACKDRKEREDIENEFKAKIEILRTDPDISNRYKALKRRQQKLRGLLLPTDSSDIDLELADLKIKYEKINKEVVDIIPDPKHKGMRTNETSNNCVDVLNLLQQKLDESESIRCANHKHSNYKIIRKLKK